MWIHYFLIINSGIGNVSINLQNSCRKLPSSRRISSSFCSKFKSVAKYPLLSIPIKMLLFSFIILLFLVPYSEQLVFTPIIVFYLDYVKSIFKTIVLSYIALKISSWGIQFKTILILSSKYSPSITIFLSLILFISILGLG